MLHALVSASAGHRLAAATRFIDGLGPAVEVVIVAPTREAADDFCRGLAVARGATFGLHRFTLGQLAARAAGVSLAARGLAPSTPLGAEAVAARATFEVRRRAQLTYLEPVAACPGFPRALASTLHELREARVDVEAVRALPDPGPDLARLFDEYDRQLTDARVVDRSGLLLETARLLREGSAAGLTGLPVLLLDVRLASDAERAVAAALADQAPTSLITIPAGDQRTQRYLPAGTAVTHDEEPHEEETTRDGGTAQSLHAPSSLSRLRRHLFSHSVAPVGTPDDEVRFFSAPGEGRECVEVARRILSEAARGVPFDEIAVVVRTPGTYWSPLEQALARAGIPAWYSRGTRRPDPTGRAFLALLACAAEGLSARRFAEYLSLGQVPRRDEGGAPAPEPTPVVASRDEVVDVGQLSLFTLLEGATAAAAKSAPPSASTAPVRDASAESPAGSTADPADVRTPWKWEALDRRILRGRRRCRSLATPAGRPVTGARAAGAGGRVRGAGCAAGRGAAPRSRGPRGASPVRATAHRRFGRAAARRDLEGLARSLRRARAACAAPSRAGARAAGRSAARWPASARSASTKCVRSWCRGCRPSSAIRPSCATGGCLSARRNSSAAAGSARCS